MSLMSLTAVALGKKIQAGEVTVEEAVLDALEQIEKKEDTIHSYVTVLEKEAILEKAKEIRAIVEPHHNCAQSVLMAFLDDLDLDRETAYKLGSCFGSGMKCGSTCGAITGALMAMGLLGLDSPEITQKFFRDFKQNHCGFIDCKDLLSENAKTGNPKKTHCDALVFEVVEYIEKLVKK